MAHTFLTDDIVTLEALDVLENQLTAAKHVTRKHEALFGTHNGSNRSTAIRVRKPPRFAGRSGATASYEDITDSSVTLTIDTQYGVDVQVTSQEMAMKVSDFREQIITPAVARIANKVDTDVLAQYVHVPNSVGVPGTSPTALSTYLNAGVLLDHESCPRDGQRKIFLGPQAQADIVDALKGLFQSSGKLASQYTSAEMGTNVAGLDWSMDQNVAVHTVGALGGTPLVNGASQTGSTLVTDGWSNSITGVVKAGDILTAAGCNAVNPVSGNSTGQLRQFVVTADANSSGAGAASISIYPSITTSGAFKTCSASPTDNGVIKIFGHASSYAGLAASQQMAWHKSAIALAFASLDIPRGTDKGSTKTDNQLGLSIRFIRDYDIDNDLWKCRFDVFYGVKMLRPEWAVRVQGA